MTIVSDTTAITTLLKASEAGLLRELFGGVLVPQAVWDELSAFHLQLPDFIFLRRMAAVGGRPPGTESLGRGEAEAIQLAFELRADWLLTDDRRARAAAARLGVRCTGLLGVLVWAKRSGRLTSVRELIPKLETSGGLYLSAEVKAEAFKLAGE